MNGAADNEKTAAVERLASNQENGVKHAENIKLDKHGYPLMPQPSDHKDDPLVSSGRGTLIKLNH